MTYWSGYDTKPMGGGNPYYCCVGCGRTDPQINGDINAHGEGCTEVARYMATFVEGVYTARREEGTHPSGFEYNNRWVVRDENGKYVDCDKYRHDLMARYQNIEFIE
jgi:hypothetical protein